jgi:DNA-binding protein HU-beta
VNKADLIEQIAQAAEISKSAAERAVDALVNSVKTSLRKGEDVTLVGFGTFSVARRRPRTIRNPRTGQAATVAGRIPRFKPSAELKRAVR